MRAALGAALAMVLTAGASTGAPPPTPPAPPGPGDAGSGDGRLITLVTGDRVLVGAGEPGHENVTMVPGPDSPSDAVQIRRTADRTYVLPAAAQPFLAAGTLDPGLFDVTGLVAQGYGDDDRSTLPLIVQYSGTRAAARELPGVTATTALNSIDAVAVEQDKDDAARFWSTFSQQGGARSADGAISHVWLDGTVRASLDESVPQIGAPQAWEAGLRRRRRRHRDPRHRRRRHPSGPRRPGHRGAELLDVRGRGGPRRARHARRLDGGGYRRGV